MATDASTKPASNAVTTSAALAPAGAGAGVADSAATATPAAPPPRKPPRPPIRKPNVPINPRPPRALFCLKLDNPLRKYSIQLVEYKYPLLAHFRTHHYLPASFVASYLFVFNNNNNNKFGSELPQRSWPSVELCLRRFSRDLVSI